MKEKKQILNKVIRIRLTNDEFSKMKKISSQTNLGVSSLIRKLTCKNIIHMTSHTNPSTVDEIRRIGNDINQIARRVNSYTNSQKFQSELQKVNIELKNLHDYIEHLRN